VKNLWYFGGLLFVLAIFGISSDKVTVPNQEIVIQFSDVEITLEETQDAIAIVKSQLEAIDVTNIQLQELGNGKLKITYHSTLDVSQVRELLSKGQALAKAASLSTDTESQFPFESNEKYYEIGIHTIHDAPDFVGTSSEGFLESKSEATRYSTPTPTVSASFNALYFRHLIATDAVAYAVYHHLALTLDNSSYIIPEVRAGPLG
jgi:hypothetical protein